DELVARLNARVGDMWRAGLVEEVRGLREAGVTFGATAARAIGYAQALGQLDGDLSEVEAIEQTAASTRKYARRQVSWFRRYRDAHWLDASAAATAGDRLGEALARVNAKLAQPGAP
ncbi:MAG TPA: tRNA dimethylallyltransferase, partial [Terrimesophilobacter sp.]|nr:tRNA dimethylallyltransferase [Terrimesophilobacter sp.]